MWEEILSKAQREAELRREDSLDDTVSTVETFVTNTVSELGRVEELEVENAGACCTTRGRKWRWRMRVPVAKRAGPSWREMERPEEKEKRIY